MPTESNFRNVVRYCQMIAAFSYRTASAVADKLLLALHLVRLHARFVIDNAKTVLHWAYLLTGLLVKGPAIIALMMAADHTSTPVKAASTEGSFVIVHEVAFVLYVLLLLIVTLFMRRK